MTDLRAQRSAAWWHATAAWVVARVCVAISMVVSDLVADHLGAPAAKRLHLDQGLMTWDATHYWSIAHRGYGGSPADSVRFFPLYPTLGWLGGLPIGGHEALPLLIVSNVAALLALVVLFRLVAEELGDADLARRSVWCLALFPAAGIMAFAYSESLALLLTLLALWSARRGRWWLAAFAALCLGLTRPVGALVVILLAGEAWRQRDRLVAARSFRRLAAVASALVAPVLGTLGYLLWIGGRFGDWMAPVDEQRKLRGAFQDPFTRLWDAVSDVLGSSRVDVFNLGFALILIAALVALVVSRRVPWGWWAFAAASLVVALSAQNFTSIGRYGIVAFPSAVGVAMLVRHRELERGWLSLSAAAMCGYLVLTFVGGQVP